MLTNKYLIAGISVLVLAVIAVAIFFVVGSGNESELPTVILTNEAKDYKSTLRTVNIKAVGPEHLPLPVKAEAALGEGWIDTESCAPGQGRYFYKTNPQSNEKLDYLLIYNISDILIGVYFYSKESLSPPTALLPEPWKIAEELSPLIDYPHSNVAVYFGDSANACNKDSKTEFPTAKLVNNTVSGMVTSVELPMIASQATVGGWVDTFLCEAGKGTFHYKLKPESDEQLEYLLIYNADDVLIGVYFFSNDTTLTEPWKIAEDLTPNNIMLIDHPHSNIVLYFGNPIGSCSLSGAGGVGTGGSHHQGSGASRGEYEATPTPAPKLNAAETINKISESLSSGSKTFKATNAADESSIATGITSSQVAELLSSITDAQEGTGKWIDNISHRGLTGNTGSITTILTSAKSNTLTVNFWVNDNNEVNLVEVSGTITHDGSEITKLSISPE